MAIPVYLWLKDDGGADIKGSVDVKDREGSIEVVAQEQICTSRPITTPAS
jgi:type VI secretion system secreted protein Hcp